MKLQNNYTTPEQSKELLEFGLPADSADCYLTRFGIDEDWEVKVLNYLKYSELAINNQKYCLPCWSAGRLIEISIMCGRGEKFKHEICIEKESFSPNLIDGLIYRLWRVADISVNEFNFSLLED